MGDLGTFGRWLIGAGLVLVVVGVVVLLAGRVPFLSSLGRLPGDLVVRRGSVTVYVPIVTSILLSVLLTLILSLLLKR